MLSFFQRKSPRRLEPHEQFLAVHAREIEGALCVFGDPFGRVAEDWHKVTGYEAKQDYLKLYFKEGETLEVWHPSGLKLEGEKFLIQHAQRVRWEWFYYGRPQTAENRYHREHLVKGDAITVTSNVTWYAPEFSPSLAKPAVTLQ
jgi:hypothetical protein